MNKKILRSVSALLVLMAAQPIASKAEITILGGINSAKPSITETPAVTTTANSELGLGVFFAKKFAPMFMIETGVLYNKEKSSFTSSAAAGNFSAKRLHIPLMLRFAPIHFLTVGAGVYYENGIGDVDYSYSSPVVISGTQTYADTGIKKSDYGVDFDLRIRIPLGPMFGFVADGRYQLGLAERGITTGSSYKTRSMQYLGGFAFGW